MGNRNMRRSVNNFRILQFVYLNSVGIGERSALVPYEMEIRILV